MSASDRTACAVRAQLAAMNAERYEVGVRAADGTMMPFTLTAEEVERRLGYFRAMNAQGSDIYIRPAGSVGLVFVDDLKAESVARMRADGLAPAVVVESSPGNYQAWVRISTRPLVPDLATEAARELAARYGGDPHAADWRHYGRLAGLTNRKEEHTRADGRQPYVLLRDAAGGEAPAAAALLERAQERFEARGGARAPAPPHPVAEGRSDAQEPSFSRPEGERVSDLSRLGRIYQGEVVRLLERYPNARAQGQLHSLDYMIVKDLARTYPTATGRELQRAMMEGSPHIHERKSWHIDDYTRRTVRKAWESLGREPEPWMRAEGGRGGSKGRADTGTGRGAATMLEDLLREQGGPARGQGAKGTKGRDRREPGRDSGPDR